MTKRSAYPVIVSLRCSGFAIRNSVIAGFVIHASRYREGADYKSYNLYLAITYIFHTHIACYNHSYLAITYIFNTFIAKYISL